MPVLHDFINTDNNVEGLRQLLRDGQDKDSRDHMGYTPMHVAVKKCGINPQETDKMALFVRELIRFGAQVNLGSDEGYTPLHLAVLFRNCKMISTLLAVKADINSLDVEAHTALHYACMRGHVEVAGEMINYEADIRVVKLLLRNKNLLVDMENWSDETALMFAAKNNDYEIVRLLLKRGALVNKVDKDENSALHHAMDHALCNPSIIEELTRYGGLFQAINKSHKNPVCIHFERLPANLTRAKVENEKKIIKLFILAGYTFSDFEKSLILQMHRAHKDCYLLEFLDSCHNEAVKIYKDKLKKKFTTSTVVFRFKDLKDKKNDNRVPYVVFDKLLDKLLRYKYPAYTDVIVSSICRHYMKQRFSQMCCDIETNILTFKYDELYLISEYLTNKEMLLIMYVCLKKGPSSSLSRLPRCTVS